MYEPTTAVSTGHAEGPGPAAHGTVEGESPWPRTAIAVSRRRTFAPQEFIYHEGDAVHSVYVIRSGMVKLICYLPNGRARILRLHGPGDSIGLEGLLGQPYAHTAMAIGEVGLERFSIPVLRRLHQEDPSALAGMLRQWQEHLAQADRWIADFSTGEIKPRLARLLRFLAELEYGGAADRVELLTGPEMADILGVTPESVSRILAGFKRSEMLQKDEGTLREVYHLDTGKLQEAAQQ